MKRKFSAYREIDLTSTIESHRKELHKKARTLILEKPLFRKNRADYLKPTSNKDYGRVTKVAVVQDNKPLIGNSLVMVLSFIAGIAVCFLANFKL